MGTQPSTNEPDYRLYARPKPGESGDWVEVVADGGERTARGADGGEFSDNDVDGVKREGAFVPDAARQRRTNPYLHAAWAVVGLMLAIGLFWFFAPADNSLYGSGSPVIDRKTIMLINFRMMGPYFLPFGLAAAFALLTVQAVDHRRQSRD